MLWGIWSFEVTGIQRIQARVVGRIALKDWSGRPMIAVCEDGRQLGRVDINAPLYWRQRVLLTNSRSRLIKNIADQVRITYPQLYPIIGGYNSVIDSLGCHRDIEP